MMEDGQYIVDIFKSMVEGSLFRANVVLGAGSGVVPSFYYGPADEISDTLTEMGKDPAREAYKFPAIFLIQDFDERFGEDIGYYCKLPSLHLVIANLSDKDWTAALRYTNNFKTILYPIFAALMEGIKQSGVFEECTWNMISCTKTDRMRWGKDGIPGFDFIDAIDIKNLSLTLKIKQ